MLFLLLSIISGTAVFIIFKIFEQKQINLLPAITMNYITASSIGLLLVPDLQSAVNGAAQAPPWTIGGLLLGISFITVFYLMAVAAQRIGVSLTTVSSKMSLVVVMVLFILIRTDESFNLFKIIALLLAIGGVLFSSVDGSLTDFRLSQLGWPLMILFGSVIVDFGVAYFSFGPANKSELALYGCLGFCMAALCGIGATLYAVITGKTTIRIREVIGGLILGIANYGAIYMLILAYNSRLLPESSLLPVNNLCIIILGSIAAVMIFREKLSKLNILGVVLSAVAILFLAIGN